MRSIVWAIALAACNSGAITETDTPLDPGSETSSDTGSDTASDTGSDTSSDTDSDTSAPVRWYDPGLPYRVSLELHHDAALAHQVATPFVDFRATLDAFGEPAALDPGSLRAVYWADPTTPVVLPSQFLDGHTDLFAPLPDSDVLGDDRGVVALVLAALPNTTDATVELYFNTGAPTVPPAPAFPATATAGTLATGDLLAEFDDQRGGLLSALYLADSPSLTSQADSLYGNGLNSKAPPNAWKITPQGAPGQLTPLASGPVVAGLSATGARADDQSAYSYRFDYWVFADQPILWMKVVQQATQDSLEEHIDDFTRGIRPWQSRQDAIVDGGSVRRTTAPDGRWVSVDNATWGLGVAWLQPPAYPTATLNVEDTGVGQAHYYFAFLANDYAASTGQTPGTIPQGTLFLDHDIAAIVPYVPSADPSAQLEPMLAPVTVVVGAAEAL